MKRIHAWRSSLAGALVLLSIGVEAAAQEEAVEPRRELFEFRSGMWFNLHHFLFQQALGEKQIAADPESRASLLATKVRADLGGLSDEERQQFLAARDAYRDTMIDRDLLFDQGMVEIKNNLAAVEDDALLDDVDLPDALIEVLSEVGESYRTHFWPAHDALNRRWIESVEPLVAKHGALLAGRLCALFRTEWPEQPIPVDLSIYANWSGAFTTIGPTHITIGSRDRGNQGRMALEVVFHEAAHGLMRNIWNLIEGHSEDQGKKAPHNFWHALLFYSVGEYTREVYGDYTPYAEKFGLYERGWQEYHRVLKRHWKACLDDPELGDATIATMLAEL